MTVNLRLQIFLLKVLLFGLVEYCKICYVTHDDKVRVGLFVRNSVETNTILRTWHKPVENGYVETSHTALSYQYSVVLVSYSVVYVGYISLASGTVTFISLCYKKISVSHLPVFPAQQRNSNARDFKIHWRFMLQKKPIFNVV
jgi:hypothetical protein